MFRFVHTTTDYVVINNFDWINLNVSDESHLTEVIMTGTGQWERANRNLTLNSICVKNIQPDLNCSRCADDAFCRYSDFDRNVTECICPNHKRGLNCDIDLCSNCQNNGYCQISETNQVQCICPRPFDGKHCEINLCPHCKNGGYCTVNDGQFLTNLTNLTKLTNLTNLTNLTDLGVSECICQVDFHGKFCEKGWLIKLFYRLR